MQLSQNFTLAEFTRSAAALRLGIANVPSDETVDNLRVLCSNVLQPLRDHLRIPVNITSGYRCPALNRAVGGVANSQHLSGQAADLRIPRLPGSGKPDLTAARLWMDFIEHSLTFDQLILEHSHAGSYWIHVSCRPDPANNRRQVIRDLLKK